MMIKNELQCASVRYNRGSYCSSCFSVLQCATTEAATSDASVYCSYFSCCFSVLQRATTEADTSDASVYCSYFSCCSCCSSCCCFSVLQCATTEAATSAASVYCSCCSYFICCSCCSYFSRCCFSALQKLPRVLKKTFFKYIFFLSRALGYLNFWG